MNNQSSTEDLIRELEEALQQLNDWETVETTTSGLPDVDFNMFSIDLPSPTANTTEEVTSLCRNEELELNVEIPSQDTTPAEIPSQDTTPAQIPSQDTTPAQIPSQDTTPAQIPSQDTTPAQIPSQDTTTAQIPSQDTTDPAQTPSQDTTGPAQTPSQDTSPDTAPLCCGCSAGAALWCPQCNLDYCKACSDGAHRFVALAGHSPAPLEEATVVFSVGPLPPLEEVLPARLPSRYFSVDKLLAFQQGSLHAVRRSGHGLPYPDFTQYHLLYDFFYSEVDTEGFKSLKNQVGRMVQTCRSRADVTCLLQYILDTLLERKRTLSAKVRSKCVALRDGPQSSLKRDRKAEGSFHRVLRANQLFVHSLFALVKDEVATRSNLQRDYLIEDVAEILLMSRHLFYPHKAINRTSSSG